MTPLASFYTHITSKFNDIYAVCLCDLTGAKIDVFVRPNSSHNVKDLVSSDSLVKMVNVFQEQSVYLDKGAPQYLLLAHEGGNQNVLTIKYSSFFLNVYLDGLNQLSEIIQNKESIGTNLEFINTVVLP